ISYAIPQWIRPLFQDVETDADDYYSFDLAKIGDWQKQFRMLTAGKYDLIIELHQTGRNAKFFKFPADKIDKSIFKNEMFDYGLFIATLHCIEGEKERLRIAHNGFLKVRNHHTQIQRVDLIIEKYNEWKISQ
ncbi:MAG: hypothetical protein WCL22_07160, partial [bacterium]